MVHCCSNSILIFFFFIPPGFLLPSLPVREQKPLVLHRRCRWSVQLVLCVRQVFFEAGVKGASRFADVEFSFLAASFLWFACLFFSPPGTPFPTSDSTSAALFDCAISHQICTVQFPYASHHPVILTLHLPSSQ